MVNKKSIVFILTEIHGERNRQDEKWGEQNHHPLYWLGILMEEVGEAAKAAIEGKWTDYDQEMKQVAAVAVAALESHRRNPMEAEDGSNDR